MTHPPVGRFRSLNAAKIAETVGRLRDRVEDRFPASGLGLAGKVAALHIQDFDDPVALQAVNEVEGLTTGLSRKIWQKLMILHAVAPGT